MTSVRFAVLQITLIAISGLIGTLVRQFPAFALRDAGAYAAQVADMHRRWDGIAVGGVSIGPMLVGVFDRLGLFRIFTAPWFALLLTVLVVSIVCCTLNRTPRLWRGVRQVNVEQPSAFFDLRLGERAVTAGGNALPGDIRGVLRSRHFKLRTAERDGVTYVYGDRNQYFKLATLFTHLGLILFLAGGAITAAVGFETVLFVGEGQTAPVAPVGTPHNLLVKNISFQAPRRADGSFEDFRTDLAVYQDGAEVARKTIRVNDPLELNGYVFHQNTFGPSASVDIHDPSGALVWTGPIILTQDPTTGIPSAFQTVPGSQLGVEMLLTRTTDNAPVLGLVGLGAADATGGVPVEFLTALRLGATSDPAETGGYTFTWNQAGAWTGLVVKNDPGQNVIWVAFVSLITGLLLTFYMPRRRVWARFAGGTLQLAMLADRYVDVRREFAELLETIAARTGDRPVQGER